VLEDAADLFPRKTGLGPPAPQHLEWTLPGAWINPALNAIWLPDVADVTPFIHNPATTNAERVANMLALEKEITSIFNIFYSAYTDVLKTMNEYFKNAEQKLIAAYPVYKNIITAVNNSPTKLPPSSAVAGKYAYVDNTRGVWKSPANVSLEAVKSVTYQVEDKEQQSINVDVNSGKSINVIRYFTGKGNLIWGARTLAGNDNEWRYISVRRFFNMVEESVKKSTAWAVFEPNDANTWIKVKGMIDNFLILQWRAGALQGAKPADAFYVKVGLGETMTSLDILEGRMNVEIGMAVVRPAEFIILTFSHKLVES
jgi:phage tail sheath protein FI